MENFILGGQLYHKNTLAQLFPSEFLKFSQNSLPKVQNTYNEWMFLFVRLFTVFFKHLTYFMPMVPFYTPWKNQKIRNFLIFSAVIETEP